jgi:hypothetical protein
MANSAEFLVSNKSTLIAACLAIGSNCFAQTTRDGRAADARDESRARIVAVGDFDAASVGQHGYCGSMQDMRKGDTTGTSIHANHRAWIRISGRPLPRMRCIGDYSFVPQQDKAYITRLTDIGGACVAELFRVVPGETPVREPMQREEHRSCLVPSNHEQQQEQAQQQ